MSEYACWAGTGTLAERKSRGDKTDIELFLAGLCDRDRWTLLRLFDANLGIV